MRYLTTTDPTHTTRVFYPEDPDPMSQTLHQNDIHDLVQDRIGVDYDAQPQAFAVQLSEARRGADEAGHHPRVL